MSWCQAEERCGGWDRRNRVPAATDGTLCEGCLRAGEHAVAALEYDYVDLEQHMVPDSRAGEPISGTREAPIPIAVGIEALQRDIWLLATTWAAVLIEVDRLTPLPTQVRDGWAVQHALIIIRPRVARLSVVPAVTVAPFGPDGDEELHTGAEGILAMVRLHGKVRAALGLTRLVHEMPGECRACGMPTLRRDNGSEEIHCAACYAWWGTLDDYHRYAALRSGLRPRSRAKPAA